MLKYLTLCRRIAVHQLIHRRALHDSLGAVSAACRIFKAVYLSELPEHGKSAVEITSDGIQRYAVIAALYPLAELLCGKVLDADIDTETVLPAL